ncbi:MAG: preprotein translocase subunit YajC [Gordonia sp. (in: high G+C Gram-positive bacteria)]|uniref:preprotein translocase subunit YajC n=1 Tax=Gordonia sp. (in: high G+C Gram-positive bacteria) TaxID=84139 RepID=UPI0039E2A3B7
MELFLPLLLILLGVMMFFNARRFKRQQAAANEMRAALTTGARVQLISGLYGTIIDVNGDFVDIETAPGVVGRYDKIAVREVVATERAAQTYVGAVVEEAAPELESGTPSADDAADK